VVADRPGADDASGVASSMERALANFVDAGKLSEVESF
jgi:hypothetical protein